MAVSVVEYVPVEWTGNNTSATVTFTQTPQPGDVVVVAHMLALGGAPVSASGLGASWAAKGTYQSAGAGGIMHESTVLVGTGATAAGAVTVTWTTGRYGAIRAYLLRGLSSSRVRIAGQSVTNGTALAGPTTSAGPGQFLADLVYTKTNGATTASVPFTFTPAAGWTTGAWTGNNFVWGTWNSAHRVPAIREPHQLSLTATAANDYTIVQVVVGDDPAPTSVEGLPKSLWLRAKNAGDSGATVRTWYDESGAGKNGVMNGNDINVVGGTTPSGGKALRFTGIGASHFALPDLGLTTAPVPSDGTYNVTPENLFDGDPGTNWTINGDGFVTFALASARTLTGYALTTVANSQPTDWTLSGSNDKSTWTVIDTRAGQTLAASSTIPFTVTGAAAYPYYKLALTNVGGNRALSGMTVSDASGNVPILPMYRDGEMWMVIKADSATGGSGFWNSADNDSYEDLYPNSAGNVVSAFGEAGAAKSFAPGVDVTQFRLLRIAVTNTTWTAWLDGTQKIATAPTRKRWTQSQYKLGRSLLWGASKYFTGHIAEVMIRPKVSTPAEAADLIAYFNTEHGLTVPGGSVPTTTSSLPITVDMGATASQANSPDTIGSGSLLDWWKADAVTGVADGGAVGYTSLPNQITGRAFDGALQNGVYRASGGPSGTPYLDGSTTSGVAYRRGATVPGPTGDFTYFAVLKTNSAAVQSITGSVSNGGAEFRLNNYKVEVNRDGVQAIAASTIALTPNTWAVVLVSYAKATGVLKVRIGNTTETINGVAGATFTSPGMLTLGNYQGNGNPFLGGFTEVGRYTSVLSASDETALLNYLNAKYFPAVAVPTTTSSLPITVGMAATARAKAAGYSGEVLWDSPVVYWRFGETTGTTAADTSGNGRTGTYTNAPTLGATSLVGEAGDKALSIAQDSGQCVTVPSAAWMDAIKSVEAWVTFATSWDLQNGDPIVSRYFTNYDWLLWRDTSGHLAVQVKIAGTFINLASALQPVQGQTYHVAFTHDGTTLRLYVNGVEAGNIAAAGTIETGAAPLEVGRYSQSATTVPAITVDEVAAYGTPLSAARVAAHYSAGVGTPTTTATLPVSVGMAPAARTVLTTTAALGASVGMAASASSPSAPTTSSLPALVGLAVTADRTTTVEYLSPPDGSEINTTASTAFQWAVTAGNSGGTAQDWYYAAGFQVERIDTSALVYEVVKSYTSGSAPVIYWTIPADLGGVPLRWRGRSWLDEDTVSAWSAWSSIYPTNRTASSLPITVGLSPTAQQVGRVTSSLPLAVGMAVRAGTVGAAFNLDLTGTARMAIAFAHYTIAMALTGTGTFTQTAPKNSTDVGMDLTAGSSFGLILPRQRVVDPVTGRAPYRLVLVDMFGERVAELPNAQIGPLDDPLNATGGFEFTLPEDDPKTTLCLVPQREIQVWRGRDLIDWYVLVRARGDDKTVAFQCATLDWYLGKRVMGASPMPNLLKNGSFEDGERYWNFGYVAGSIPAKPPLHSITTDTINGTKALQISGASGTQSASSTIEGDIAFAYDSATLTATGISQIDALAASIVSATPDIRCDGHADSTGTSAYNYDLSLRRANAVRDRILVTKPSANITVTAYGETRPRATNTTAAGRALNRRVEVSFSAALTAKGHRQYAGQSFTYTNPTSAKKVKTLTLVGWTKITQYLNASKDGWGVYIERVKADDPTKVLAKGFVPIGAETPRNRWNRMECAVTVPADGIAYRFNVRLYPPEGTCIWDEISVTASEQLAFYDTDQALIVKGLVEHAQDEALGKTTLNLATRTPLTKVKRTREYPWVERLQISEAVAEFPTLANGMDTHIEVGAATRTLVTSHPRKGQNSNYVLALGSNIATFAVDYDGEQTATRVIVQAEGEGSDREEGVWTDTSKMNGVVLEKVYNATPGSAISSLTAQAKRGIARYSRPVVIPAVVMRPEFTDELLDRVAKGDVVRVQIRKGWMDIDDLYRVTNRQLDPRTDQITYTLTPEDVTP